ncbi:hypothetical protein ABGN05_00325 [Aquibium sp. LZ166]|uniref:Uncharacterized protein n=1 Tax=Aquibium pacificus TaxID=3153579 RepID=A0ABV3SBH9_9HYPH
MTTFFVPRPDRGSDPAATDEALLLAAGAADEASSPHPAGGAPVILPGARRLSVVNDPAAIAAIEAFPANLPAAR